MNKIPESATHYIRNPDVVLREEDEDGGLLFNPDTNQVKVVNQTALFIWKLCDGSQDRNGVVAAVSQAFEEVPKDQASNDVQEFLDEMVGAGFIGTAESM